MVRISRCRLPCPGPDLGGQRGERAGSLLVVPQDAQAGAGHRAQHHPVRPVHQVVLAVAQEGEVIVGQPAQQRLGLGRRLGPGSAASRSASLPWPASSASSSPGPASCRCRSSTATRTSPRPSCRVSGGAVHGCAVGGGPADLDVRPGFGDLVVRAVRAGERPAHVVQRPGHVPADPQLRMQDVIAVQAAPGQFHGHRVDQERHVVGDDVDHPAGRVERAGRADPDTRTRARPCGRCAANAACSVATAAIRAGPASARSSTATCR